MQNQSRIVVENVAPQLNAGKVFIKRVVDEIVNVTADVLVDGHDVLQASLLFKHESEKIWKEVRMQHSSNDEYTASFQTKKQGLYAYKVQGWVDYALNWQHGIERKIEDSQHVNSELLEGAELLFAIIDKVTAKEKEYLLHLMYIFKNSETYHEAIKEATSKKLTQILIKNPEKFLTHTSQEYPAYVDRQKARFSTWYEFFPRSASEHEGKHGTFNDCHRLLPRIAKMGFDTLYFPPVHPIGEVNRKGKNNTTVAKDGDVGSTWGIGSKHGGHKDLHPQLGSLEDFKNLVSEAKKQGIEVAMDYALQAAPDHPWVTEHPDWFKWRPDGTVQYAENPPKKYQDILPIYWESKDFKNLWKECLDTLFYWIDCGINVFRVDNPHTKPYYFWNWAIAEVKKKHPDVIFLDIGNDGEVYAADQTSEFTRFQESSKSFQRLNTQIGNVGYEFLDFAVDSEGGIWVYINDIQAMITGLYREFGGTLKEYTVPSGTNSGVAIAPDDTVIDLYFKKIYPAAIDSVLEVCNLFRKDSNLCFCPPCVVCIYSSCLKCIFY